MVEHTMKNTSHKFPMHALQHIYRSMEFWNGKCVGTLGLQLWAEWEPADWSLLDQGWESLASSVFWHVHMLKLTEYEAVGGLGPVFPYAIGIVFTDCYISDQNVMSWAPCISLF